MLRADAGAVHVALRGFFADVRHVGQPALAKRAFPVRGRRHGGSEGGGSGGRP